MQWEGREESRNVDDRRGRGKAGLAVGGIGGLIIVILGLIFNVDIQKFLGQGGPGGNQQQPTDPEEDKLAHFAKVVFGDTERVWEKQFAQMNPPREYRKTNLVLFRREVNTVCSAPVPMIGP